ncbi:helix-turn-helix transcriptional regulator [Magnetovibrio blakemorei]|uniref:Transcriptional Regulator, LuxR family n=1 Tax=Magnetovibrio blakemorei TaxID=28181 RepID=C4RAJ6_9PROT|nr:LuxR family transcriptional regulator [Magnetovibrio blakemorei]OEJ67347.1 hypothetical protein BEN30_09430 [Magnetovibrio blakemorei]CAV30841.1 Transcriptional Regulator, LuxR family [Magnetovibrio blakemorei]
MHTSILQKISGDATKGSNLLQEASAFFELLQAQSCIDDCWMALLEEVGRHGFDWAMYGFGRRRNDSEELEITYFSNYSKEWQDEYEKLGGSQNDIDTLHCISSTEDQIFFSPETRENLTPEQKAIDEFAQRSGIKNGISFPLRAGPDINDWGGLGLSTRMDDDEFSAVLDERRDYLRLIAQVFHAVTQSRPLAKNALLLTEKEKQALSLTAKGLKTKQIADKLGMSDKAVDQHIARATAKLASTTRTQAVAEAIRLHILRL